MKYFLTQHPNHWTTSDSNTVPRTDIRVFSLLLSRRISMVTRALPADIAAQADLLHFESFEDFCSVVTQLIIDKRDREDRAKQGGYSLAGKRTTNQTQSPPRNAAQTNNQGSASNQASGNRQARAQSAQPNTPPSTATTPQRQQPTPRAAPNTNRPT